MNNIYIPESTQVELASIKPCRRNTKKHPQVQIDNIAESIRQFGFVQPLVLDGNKENEIIIGHGRYFAAKQLKMNAVPCVFVKDLTDEQIRKLRILDNKLNESEWDFDNLKLELEDLDFFDFGDIDFGVNFDNEYERKQKELKERLETSELSEDDEEYQEFVNKFENKKTTDDCYTPQLVYDAVANYVAEKYGVDKNDFVRPFYPNGDYKKEKYKSTDIVVDNPPFSILAEILKFYNEHGIKFFLFAPHLTLFTSLSSLSSCLGCGVAITYENGASVSTSFITNMEDCAFRSAPKLYKVIKQANDENLKQQKKQLPKYNYPLSVVLSSTLSPFSRLGIEFEVKKDECYFIRQLDCQKQANKGIFGNGYLISERKRIEREKAEKEKAEKEKAEKEKAEKEKAEKWELSDREKNIIRRLK